MRSVERSVVRAALASCFVALAGCSSVGGKPTVPPAAPPAAATVPAPAKPVAVAADTTVKEAAAPAPAPAKPEPPPLSAAVQRAFDAARQALAAGRIAEAERGFAALAKSHPDLSGTFGNLGLIHRQAGKYPEAIAAFDRAIALSPQRADLHNQLGITQRMAGEFAKARISYERAIAIDANYAPAVLNLGILYDLYLWDGRRALELYDRYLQLTPGGDEQVTRWVSDLKNRNARKSAAQGKEQG